MGRLLHRVSSLCRLLLIAAPLGAASAAPLVLNQTVPFDPAPAGRPDLAGPVIAESTSAFSFGDFCCAGEAAWTVSGSITSRVVRAADGTLDFYWQTSQQMTPVVGAEVPWGVVQLQLSGFYDPRLHYDAGWIEGTGSNHPETASVYEGVPVPFADHTILINFPVQSEQSSSWFFLDTNATDYTPGAALYAAGQIWTHPTSGPIPTFAPVVPEPAAWSLMLAGGVLVGWVRFTRSRSSRPSAATRGAPRGAAVPAR